ncbi:MAG: hypothetical protein ACJAVK_003433 [Akkermansiaceae bacterium]|jgi:hypothetical protein
MLAVSLRFRARVPDFPKGLLEERVSGAMKANKRFIKVFSLEKTGRFIG